MADGSLQRIEKRQVETNALLMELIGLFETLSGNQEKMLGLLIGLDGWIREPPKSDIGDLLRRLAASIDDLPKKIIEAMDRHHAEGHA